MKDQSKESQDINQLFELALAAMSKVEKYSLSSTHTIRSHAIATPKDSSVIVTKIEHDVDRPNKMAHMRVLENHENGSNQYEVYHVGGAQYSGTADAWHKSAMKSDRFQGMFEQKGIISLDSLSALRSREFSVQPPDHEGVVTLATKISGQEIANQVAATQAAFQGQGTVLGQLLDVEIEVDINRHTYLIEAFRVEATSMSGNVESRESLEVVVRPLSAAFSIKLPATLAAMAVMPKGVAGTEDLHLGAEAAAACWCTGCTACVACLACLACLGCIACIFPPLLAPVTAAAAGTAIATAVSVSVGASVGIATAIQKGG
jgi:hypothetical protein